MTSHLHRLSPTTLLIALTVVLLAAFVPSARAQVPVFPQAFYGEVIAAGQPAPVGSVIEARGAGVKTGIPFNPLVTSVAGKYGGRGAFDPKLLVQGSVADGTLIEFYVNGAKAEVAEPAGEWRGNYTFKTNTVVTLNLRVLADIPPAPPVTRIPTQTPAPLTATLPPPQTAVPTATELPHEATAESSGDTTAAPATTVRLQAQPTAARPAPILASPSTNSGSEATPTPDAPTLAQATSASTATRTHTETRIAPSSTVMFKATPSPRRVAVAAGTARPTSAPILVGGGDAPAREAHAPDAPQEASRSIALGSGLALVVAATTVGIVAMILRRRIR
jgi:hypothetical protein